MNRLFEIIYLLLEKKTITAKELANYFEVSTRTIYRDIEHLSQAKIPIYTNQGKGGGICLLEDFVMDKSLLSKEEKNEILFALQSLGKLGVQEEKEILQKMSHFFCVDSKDWITIDFSDWGKDESQKEDFQVIKQAILTNHVLSFLYYNSYGQEKRRIVEPLQICFKEKAWYIKAFCKEKQDYRLFKMSRMKELKMLEEIFQRELPKEEDKKTVSIPIVSLTLEISKEVSYRIFDEFKKEAIVEEKENSYILQVEYPDNDWVDGYLLSYGDSLKVITPSYLKKRIQKRIQVMIENYF